MTSSNDIQITKIFLTMRFIICLVLKFPHNEIADNVFSAAITVKYADYEPVNTTLFKKIQFVLFFISDINELVDENQT